MSIILSDGYILLRRYHERDVNDVYEAVCESCLDLYPWFAWCHENFSLEEAEQFIKDQSSWWEEGEVYNFAITDQGRGTYFGGCVLNNINQGDRLANIAYWVRSGWARRGIATASVKLAANYGFEHLGLNRLEIVVAKENVASIRVAEKVGAKREGELRRRITVRDQVYDAFLYSLIPGDIK